jgi:glucose-1-phosphate adenylyltransferase
MPSTPKVLALVMAGGPGSRLEVLTESRAKPAMPYAGVYRLIDFPLSNCMHSRLEDVWIIQQYQPYSLGDHISSGRPWDLDRTYGGLRLLHPHQGGEESGWHRGNADAIFRNKSFIEEFGPDLLVVLSSDHVYKLDYGSVIETHIEARAELTIVTTQVERDEASRFGVVEVGAGGRITGFAYKPEVPSTDVVTTEVFVFTAAKTISVLEELASLSENSDDDSDPLQDFGDALVPRFVEGGHAYEHRLEGYWRDLGTVESYWVAHMDLLGPEPRIRLDDPRWPIHTLGAQRPPAHIGREARIEDSLLSPGCVVRGEVVRSVLAPGVVVAEHAVVRDSVVLQETTIGAGASLDLSVTDVECSLGEGARVGRARGSRAPEDIGASDIAVVGRGADIAPGATVDAGARIEPSG